MAEQEAHNTEALDSTDAVNLDTMNLDLPSAEFERQLIAKLKTQHREFAKAVFDTGQKVLVRWRIERVRRRRG